MFATQLTSKQQQSVKIAWLELEAIVKNLPPSAMTALLMFRTRSLLDELDEAEIDIGTVHSATARLNFVTQGNSFLSEIDAALAHINQVLNALMNE